MNRYRTNQYGIKERDLHQEWVDKYEPKQSQRMAGEDIPEGLDELIASVRSDKDISDYLADEKAANSQQNNYVAQQLGRFADIDASFERAGVPRDRVSDLQTIQALANGVPAPYIDMESKPGLERRVHTGITVNPYTKEREIVGFRNPETGEVLVTEFGDGRDGRIDGISIDTNDPSEVGDRASEYLGKRIMWLNGDMSARLDNTVNPYQPDIKTKDGRGIDVHTLRSGVHDRNVEMQVNTGLVPRQDVMMSGERMSDTVDRLIKGEMESGKNLGQAIQSIKDQGLVDPMRNRRGEDVSAGKMYKDGYDELISPKFDRNEALLNVYDKVSRPNSRLSNNMQDKSVLKPEKVYSIDIAQVRDSIESQAPESQMRKVKVNDNSGNNGRGRDRARVNVQVPLNTPGVNDISNKGYVAQIMRDLQYK